MLNEIGELIPPWFTPLANVKCVEMVLPQWTIICWCVCQKHNSLILNNGTFFLINLSNKFVWCRGKASDLAPTSCHKTYTLCAVGQ